MPLGDPQTYINEGMPPEQAMAAAYPQDAGMTGMENTGMEGMEPQQDQMMMMLLQALMQKWGGSEAQITAEKDMLMQTLMQLAQGGAPAPGPQGFVEGGVPPMGMM